MTTLFLIMISLNVHAATGLREWCADALIRATDKPLPGFQDECRNVAREKMESVVRNAGGKIVEMTFVATEVDARRLSPSGYIWFSALVTMPDGSVKRVDTMTQKSVGFACI